MQKKRHASKQRPRWGWAQRPHTHNTQTLRSVSVRFQERFQENIQGHNEVNLGKSQKHKVFRVRASLIAQLVKNPPAMRETWVWSLGWEDHLEKGKTTHSGISGVENSMDYIVYGVSESDRMSDFHFSLLAPHSPNSSSATQRGVRAEH